MKKLASSQKKKAWLTLFSALCALMLMGCSSREPMPANSPAATGQASPSPAAQSTMAPAAQSDLKDGTYTSQVSQAYAEKNGGWKEYVTLTVSGGQLTDVEYDAEQEGKKKRDATPEEYPMDPHPSAWIPELENNIRMAEHPEDIDAVAGATQSSQLVRELYAAALNAARSGNTQVVTLADDGTPESMSTDPETTNQQGGQE